MFFKNSLKLIINITTMNTITFCGICKSVNDAAENGHLECLKYLHENRCQWDERACTYAAANGHLECLKYLHENRCQWDERACTYAAENGHLDCLKYLHENECPWDERACTYAAENGHLDCLKYLHENRCPWDKWACSYAAEKGHLDCLKYLHKNKCPWDKWACSYAARNGHLECLEYLHKNRCPWDKWACDHAAANGHIKCLKYLHENGCPCIHSRLKLKIYSTDFDIQAEKEDPDTRSAGGAFGAGPAGASRFVATECCICYTNRNKVQFKPCNHTLCIGCSNKIITKNNAENKDTTCPFCRGNVEENLLLAN